jgi:hypothetical protein
MTRPDVIYDNEKQEFRQFGTTDGKTLLPIYIVGILLATILYVFFYYLAQHYKESKKKSIVVEDLYDTYHGNKLEIEDKYYHLQQQQQIQQLQNQINQLIQQQMNNQIQNIVKSSAKPNIISNELVLPNSLNI